MAHISTSGDKTKVRVPSEWLSINAQMGQQANAWARRSDMVANIGPLACEVNPVTGKPMAAALFKPAIAEMEINTDMAFEGLKPEHVGDFTQRSTHFEHPAVAGAVLHEAMHARHTRFELPDLVKVARKEKNPYLADLVMWFEETRIERRGRRHFPRNRSLMRSCALKLSLMELPSASDLEKAGSMGLSNLLLITAARVDIDVLDMDDVRGPVDTIRGIFGDELYDKLRVIWYRAQRRNCDRDFKPLLEDAREWLETLKEHDQEPPPPPQMMMISMSGPGTGEQDGDDDQDGDPSGAMQGLLDDLQEAAEDAESAGQTEAFQQAINEMMEEAAKAAQEAANEAKDHKDEASRIFSKSTVDMRGDTNSSLQRKRDPSSAERAAAVQLSKLLDKARYRDRVITQTNTVEPPGRLRGRGAVQAAAGRAAGRTEPVEMWKRKKRTHVEDPNLTVGIMCDISGSMHAAMRPIASTTWIVQEAGRRIQANVAAVYYGNSAFPVLKPGQHQTQVFEYDAPDGTERFTSAFKALDGALGLLNGTGARLLVIVSDCCYTGSEAVALDRYMKRCLQAGVGVVIYNPEDSTHYIDAHLGTPRPANVEVIAGGGIGAIDLAKQVGAAAVRSLERMGGRSA